MIRIPAEAVTQAITALFTGKDMPAGLRCQGVLTGHFPGEIYTDDPQHPTWGVVRESVYGTLYPQGAITKGILSQLVNELRSSGEVLVGYWPDDVLTSFLPDEPQYEGSVYDFLDPQPTEHWETIEDTLPDGCSVRKMDEILLRQSPWYEDRLDTYGSLEAILNREIGYGLVRDNILLSEATASPIAANIWEVGTITHQDHRRKGYATIVCTYLLKECMARGLQTYWNCNKDNAPSVALAQKLGYRSQREYRLVGWFPTI